MKASVTMSLKELGRAEAVARPSQKQMTQRVAAEQRGISERRLRRIQRAYESFFVELHGEALAHQCCCGAEPRAAGMVLAESCAMRFINRVGGPSLSRLEATGIAFQAPRTRAEQSFIDKSFQLENKQKLASEVHVAECEEHRKHAKNCERREYA